jgi:flavin-dependent dehydrogenase
VVRRADFDAWLLGEAVGAGAEFRPSCLPAGMERTPTGARLRIAGEWLGTDRLIGADGAASWTARRLGLRPKAVAWGMEAVAPGRIVPRPLFDFACGERGYAWAFPRPGGASVGVYSMRREGIGREFDRFAATLGPALQAGPARLWMAPLGMSAVTGWGGTVLLAGDAAGAVDPYLGEGIRYALQSGANAAESVLGGSDYAGWFGRELAAEFRAAGRMRALFYALSPAMLERLLGHPGVREGFTAILAGRRTYRGSWGAWRRLPALLRPGIT